MYVYIYIYIYIYIYMYIYMYVYGLTPEVNLLLRSIIEFYQ